MVYKLLISYELNPKEVVQGNIYTIKISITNIGEDTFPGGRIKLFQVKYEGFDSPTQSKMPSVLPEISNIEVNETINLIPHRFYALKDGVSWVNINIESNDKEKIEFYQSPKALIEPIWKSPFNISNRENKEIIDLLHKILEKLDSLSRDYNRGE